MKLVNSTLSLICRADIGIFVHKSDVGSFPGLASVSGTTGLNPSKTPTGSLPYKEHFFGKYQKEYIKIYDMALIDDLDNGKQA